MTPLAVFALAGCLSVAPDAANIQAGDLAAVLPALGGDNTPVSATPAAGAPRIFGIPELRRIASRFRLSGEPERPICFERPLAPPDPARLLEALRRQLPDGRIEILDYCRTPAPAGEMEFPLTGLRRAGSEAFWSGSIRYGGGRRFAIWARVRVSVAQSRVLAVEALRPGPAILAGQLRLQTLQVFPAEKVFASSLQQVAGNAARVPIQAGVPVRLDWLSPAPDVVRGDRVVVEVHSGAAYLKLEATAEASGSVGTVIPVTNPISKKRFPARVEGKGRVSVGKSQS